jgi:hypothetical protein
MQTSPALNLASNLIAAGSTLEILGTLIGNSNKPGRIVVVTGQVTQNFAFVLPCISIVVRHIFVMEAPLFIKLTTGVALASSGLLAGAFCLLPVISVLVERDVLFYDERQEEMGQHNQKLYFKYAAETLSQVIKSINLVAMGFATASGRLAPSIAGAGLGVLTGGALLTSLSRK